MLVLVLALCLGLAAAQTEPGCDACIDGLCYMSSNYLDGPLMLMTGIPSVELTENRLYVISEHTPFYAIMPEQITDYVQKHRVPQVPNYWVVGSTVDQKTRELYLWYEHNDEHHGYLSAIKNCSFVFNPIREKAEEVHNTDEAIKQMYFKNSLYYTLKFRNGLFKYEFNRDIPAFDGYNISQFVVDKLEDVYASTEDGVYRLKKGADHVTRVSFKKYSLSTDKDESVYFMDQLDKTVLKLDYHTDRVHEVGAFSSEAKDRFIFDKYNRILAISGEQPQVEGLHNWLFLEPKEGCRINVDHEGKKTFVKVSESVWKGLARIFQ